MKQRLTELLFCLFILFNSTQSIAQNVTIPDANFVSWLQSNYPACMSGNQMDTTCIDITSEQNIFVAFASIGSLDGIRYFDNLEVLNCGNNNFSVLSTLPSGLLELNCTNGAINSLPALPPSLKILNCSGNNLTVLPTLPSDLEELNCSDNSLVTLPNLPPNLVTLRCNNNSLNTLPILPTSLDFLLCSYNQLIELPELPVQLGFLNCSNNQLNKLPLLPSSLTKLYCQVNLIDTLPALPDTMFFVHAYECQLVYITSFPNEVNSTIDVSDNYLTELPELPSVLGTLKANNNQITCIPELPNGLYGLQMAGNLISCIPNHVSAIDNNPYFDTIPYCSFSNSAINPYGCSLAKGVYGDVKFDVNNNCQFEEADLGLRQMPIKITGVLGDLEKLTNSGLYGGYNIYFTSGVHILQLDTVNKPYRVNCLYPGVDTSVILTVTDSIIDHINFLVDCKPGYDVGVKSISPIGAVAAGEEHVLSIQAGDLSDWYNETLNCADGISGTITIQVDGPVTYIGPEIGSIAPIVSGNLYSFAISDFGLVDMFSDFKLIFEVGAGAQLRDSICVNIMIDPISGDHTPENNDFDYCYEVYEYQNPIMKTAYPTRVWPDYQDWITYTIQFQNTGNDTINNIRIEDTLSSHLDLETFEIIGYSHQFRYDLWIFDRKLSVYMPDAMLIDQASNEMKSKGYIQYRIKPKSNLPSGTEIKNRAEVSFNTINTTTNTAITSFTGDLAVNQEGDFKVKVYPNPSQGTIYIDLDENLTEFEVKLFDATGREISYQLSVHGGSLILDLNSAIKGLVFVHIESHAKIFRSKLVLN